MHEVFATLPALLKEYSDSDEVHRAVAFAAWRQIAGERLGELTEPILLEEKRLIVAVPDLRWQRNLGTLASEMIFRLNSKIGTQLVTFIEFRIDKQALRPKRRAHADLVEFETEALDEITEPLRRAADVIQDDGLRRSFLLAAGSCLAREKRLAASE